MAKNNKTPLVYTVQGLICLAVSATFFIFGMDYVLFNRYAKEFDGIYISGIAICFVAFGLSILFGKMQTKAFAKAKGLRKTTPPPLLHSKTIEPIQEFEPIREVVNPKESAKKFGKFMGRFLIALTLIIIGSIAFFAKPHPNDIARANKVLAEFKAKQCVLKNHTMKRTKYKLLPIWVSTKYEQDAVRYLTDTISQSRRSEAGYPKVLYQCANGETMNTTYRFRELMVK